MIGNDNTEISPFKIINAILADHGMIADDINEKISYNSDNDELIPGRNPNWKGRPLPFGKPVVEEISGPHYGHIFRECRPIEFHLKTLCHDINNFFTCASMRTGLPRWFFLSTILLSSFFLVWLGLFFLSMVRRMRRIEVRKHI